MAPEVCCFDSIVNVSILYSAAFYDFKCIFILGVNASNQTDKLIFILCDNVLMLQSFKVRQLKLNSHAAFPVSRFLSLHPVVFHPHAHRFFLPFPPFFFPFFHFSIHLYILRNLSSLPPFLLLSPSVKSVSTLTITVR